MPDDPKRVRPAPGAPSGSRRRSGGAAVSPARRFAFATLRRVYGQQAYASPILSSLASTKVSSEDRALAQEITLGALRWQSSIDYLIERYSGRLIDRLDLPVLIALRMGIYQLRFLDRVPPSAAVNESVNLVKQSGYSSARGMVNAVLRRAASNLDDRPGEDVQEELERLSIEVSHPRWMIERWMAHFSSEARVRSLALANNQPAALAFRINKLRAPEAATIAELESRGVEIRRSVISSSGFVVRVGPAFPIIEAADKGLIYIQDEASQLAGEVVDPQPGELILDMCAAPGSKASHIAQLSGDHSRIICCDLHWRRLRILEATCKRLGVKSTESIACDGTRVLPFASGVQFDRILVDAPCSGTGTLRQNPEIKWRLTAADLRRLADVQLALIERAASVLKPGGLLVYSTCSMEPEENEDVIARVLRGPARLKKAIPQVRSELVTSDGFVRLFPDTQGCEGFFIAVLRKVG